jgi:hypothetical protein
MTCVHFFLNFECGIQMMLSFNFVDDAYHGFLKTFKLIMLSHLTNGHIHFD